MRRLSPGIDLSTKYMKLFSLLPAISLLIKIHASYLKHKLSIFAPGVPEKMEVIGIFFNVKNIFFCSNLSIFSGTLGAKIESLCFKYEACIFIRREMTGKRLKRFMYFFNKSTLDSR